VEDWLRSLVAKETRDRILASFGGQLNANTEAEFDSAEASLLRRRDVQAARGFVDYYKKNWKPIAWR
jgi:hypothetical protein